jgi:cation transport ATPase
MRLARQSVVAGLVLSGVGMIVAALGFLPPVAGALVQEGIDLAVIANALRASR